MDWSAGEWDSIVDSLFSLSMLAKLVSSNHWMDDLLEMQNPLSPLGCLRSRLVLCPFIWGHACPDHCVDFLLLVCGWPLWSYGCPIGYDLLWLGLASAVKAWSHLSSLPGPERIFQTSSIMHITSTYYQAYNLSYLFNNFPLWAKKSSVKGDSHFERGSPIFLPIIREFPRCLPPVPLLKY